MNDTPRFALLLSLDDLVWLRDVLEHVPDLPGHAYNEERRKTITSAIEAALDRAH
jgi:hypothetical protein